MASTQATAGPIGHLVVTPDMVPPAPEPLEAQAAQYRAEAAHLGELNQRLRAANTLREQSAQSGGFDEGHEVNRQLAADLSRAEGFNAGAATMFSAIAGVYRDVASRQRSIVQTAEQEAAAAKNPIQQQAIVSAHHAHARGVTAAGVEAAIAEHGHFQRQHGSDYTTLVGHDHGMPQHPSPPPPGPGHRGIAKPVDHHHPRGSDGDEDDPPPADGSQPAAAGGDRYRRGRIPGTEGTSGEATSPNQAPGTFPGAPLSPPAPSSPPARSTGLGGGGGMPSGGLGGMPASGGMGGLGPGNPLSSLTSGLGKAPGVGAGGGLSSGMPAASGLSASTPGIGQPSAAFTQGLAAGSSGGASFGGAPPATSAGGGPAASSAGGVPAAGLSAGQAVPASASGVGMPGAHVPISAAGASGGVGAAPPMMLPSPGMGAPPAAPVSAGLPAGSASVTAPAGTASGSSGGAAPAPTSAGVGGAGAALVPAPVVSAGSARPTRVPKQSPELLAAKALASRLRRDSDAALYPVIDWAVGVFRSESGSATETVFVSNEGFGYIPHGVFVPRSARLLTVDPLVDSAFRERWFGWLDPARVLVEYARLRAPGGARLVAAATTGSVVDALREFDVEHASCPRDYSEVLPAPPVLDDMHAHRLAVQCPQLYPRVTRLAGWNDRTVLNQVIVPLVMQMMDGVKHGGGGVDCPLELRAMWDALGTGDEIPQKAWDEFTLEARLYYTTTSSNPGRDGDADTGGRAVYQAQWLVARTMEVVGGWAHRPPPLADMVYAAAAAYIGDFEAELDPMLRPLEDEAAREAVC